MQRRDALTAGAATLAAGALGARTAQAKTSAPTLKPSNAGAFPVVPLPFDPKKLRGISEKIIRSHHENNYRGAVKKLNLIQKRLAALPASAHPIEMGALKREELIALNSKRLHESYFGNLGGSGKVTPTMTRALEQAFGSVARWRADFVRCAKSLSGGSGWVITTYLPEERVLLNQFAADHSDTISAGTPLLVLDMYEHAYHMDFGAAAARYIEVFLGNVDWGGVERRFLG